LIEYFELVITHSTDFEHNRDPPNSSNIQHQDVSEQSDIQQALFEHFQAQRNLLEVSREHALQEASAHPDIQQALFADIQNQRNLQQASREHELQEASAYPGVQQALFEDIQTRRNPPSNDRRPHNRRRDNRQPCRSRLYMFLNPANRRTHNTRR
jgi:hypothetical protein